MEKLNFQRIIDIISDALSIFDFSFIISGGVLYLIIYGLLKYLGLLDWIGSLNPAFVVAGSIFLIYVLGLMAWSIGKPIREFFITLKPFFKMPHAKRDEDLKQTIESTKIDLNKVVDKDFTKVDSSKNAVKADNRLIYSYMWSILSSVDNNTAKERIHFCNRYWVMQAVFEGLITDWIICIGLAIAFIANGKIHSIAFILIMLILLICLSASISRATYYSRSQIREIVANYIIFVEDNKD